MCGIVGYFGRAGNNLTRLLTAMSAINYRAPDSTGVGIFGDDIEPIRIRKALGSVNNLAALLAEVPAYPNPPETLKHIWIPENDDNGQSSQERLLEFEELPMGPYHSLSRGDRPYITFDRLFDPGTKERLQPGWPGRPGPLPAVFIHSRKDLEKIIRDLTVQYDLSFTIMHSLVRKYLFETISARHDRKSQGIEPEDILARFDKLFETLFLQEKLSRPIRLDYGWEKNPYADKYVWRYLKATPIRIPPDYDRDAIQCMFRFLDAALCCRIPANPKLHRLLQQRLEKRWPKINDYPNWNWRTLYWAEKGANIYGRAAAAVLDFMQDVFISGDPGQLVGFEPESLVDPGLTDPLTLEFFSQPIISHGRWAIQSDVTVKNAHPFLDDNGFRAIVLNGQFDSEVEAEAREFLEQVEGFEFRSENSGEYFSLLWGHYFNNLVREKHRYEVIRKQTEAGLNRFNLGSQIIDFQIFQTLKDKSNRQLDQIAFLEATRRMTQNGGQIAVTGFSLYSPRCLYVASHNRPVFIVKRTDLDDFMVVSDINAAMGLFPQGWIHDKILELNRLRKHGALKLQELKKKGINKKTIDQLKKQQDTEEKEFLAKSFPVLVYPLEGEQLFARIRTELENGQMLRQIIITDFELNPLPEIKPFHTTLAPAWVRKDLFGSFFETHLQEIPERMETILDTYLGNEGEPPLFSLKENTLHRRFGSRMGNMERIILVGMGSSANVGKMAVRTFRTLLPEIEIIVLKPVEVEDSTRWIVPEKDLVVMLSWSSTTAEMIELARALRNLHVTMMGITEKVFADMALIVAKSVGIIPVLSGEEITVSAIKSPPCMMLCLNLLAIWLAAKRKDMGGLSNLISSLQGIPEIIARLLKDTAVNEFFSKLAENSSQSHSCVVFDDLLGGGLGREIALKMEEASWTAIGKALDYQDLFNCRFQRSMNKNLVIVNATHSSRVADSVRVMKRLYMTGIEFAVVTVPNRYQEEMAFYCGNRMLILPQVLECFQSFLDLVCYYKFAFYYGRAHGRSPDEFPRNRAKSVTVSRSRSLKKMTTEREWLLLEERGRLHTQGASVTDASVSPWEKAAVFDWEKTYYQSMRELVHQLGSGPSLGALLSSDADPLEKLSGLTDSFYEDGEIILVWFDRPGRIAANNIAYQWRRYLKGVIRTTSFMEIPLPGHEQTLFIFLGTRQDVSDFLYRLHNGRIGSCLWLGRELDHSLAGLFRQSAGYYPLVLDFKDSLIDPDRLFASLCLLFTQILATEEPEKGPVLKEHLRQAEAVIHTILSDLPLMEKIHHIIRENRDYPTGFIIGPPGGAGHAWANMFERTGAMAFQDHLFGESAHGPLVTVDHRVDHKFVRLDPREKMIDQYGEAKISEWENQYLKGKTLDDFLTHPAGPKSWKIESPIFADAYWYLPVLKNGYDPVQDNLIFIDATQARALDASLDELSTFGCRHARIILISQSALQINRRGFNNHPVSHVLTLPAMYPDASHIPISGFLLPFIMNLMAMAAASAAAKVRSLAVSPVNERTLFIAAFGSLGNILVRNRFDLETMSPYLIESLKFLAPLVRNITGTARFKTLEIRKENDLHQLANTTLYPESCLDNFRVLRQTSPDLPFYMMRLDTEHSDGKIPKLLYDLVPHDQKNLWIEPFGNAWKVLNHRVLGLWKAENDRTLLMLPLFENGRGWLVCAAVEYILWDHDIPLEAQLDNILLGLGKDMRFHEHIAPRYLKISGKFNEEMAEHGLIWDDRLIGFVQISLLMKQSSHEIVMVIIERLKQLLDLKGPQENPPALKELLARVEGAWTNISVKNAHDDKTRWKSLHNACLSP